MAEAKLRIALIEPVGGHGGMDFYDYGLAQGLGKNNVEVLYFTSTQTTRREYENVKTNFTFEHVWTTSIKLVRLFYFLKGYYKSFQISRKDNVKIIHLQFFDLGGLNLLVMILASFFQFKKILTLHDVSSFNSDNSSFLEKMILSRFSEIIVHNKLSFEELSRKVGKEQQAHIIPHGNYLPFVDELPYSHEKDEKLNLLFFGQIKKVKGLEILLEAMQKVVQKNRNINLIIAGKPWHDEKDKYINLIKSMNLEKNVFTKFEYIPNEEVSKYFKSSDIVVLPYKKIYQSGVLLLSMSYGRVTLTSDLAAFREVIRDEETGLTFRTEDADHLAEVILSAAGKKEKLMEIRTNASQLLKNDYDWSSIGRRTKEIYTR